MPTSKYRTTYLTECCCSCKCWDKASKNVPVDVRRVPKRGELIEVSSAGKLTKIQGWDWELANPGSMDEVALLRLCFFKGIVKPWSRCNNYSPISADKRSPCYLEVGCKHSAMCPIYQSLTSYIR